MSNRVAVLECFIICEHCSGCSSSIDMWKWLLLVCRLKGGREQEQTNNRGGARVKFSCYHVIKSERLNSFSVTPLAIRACCNVGTIVSASSRQYSKQAWYMQTFIVHTIAYHVVHTNIHCAHHSILRGTYKHSLCTP